MGTAGEDRESRPTRWSFTLMLLPILGSVLAVSVSGRFASNAPLLTACLLAGGLAWLIAVTLAKRGAGEVHVVVAGAIALRVVAWSGNAGLSDDAYRYAWEGEVVIEGANPYAYAPSDLSDPGVVRARTAFPVLHARVNHPEVRAAYPPLAQAIGLATAAVCRVFDLAPEHGGIRILQGVFGLCDLLVLWPLSVLLRRARLSPALMVVWAWSPLAALEFAGTGHLDSLGILLLLGSLAVACTRTSTAPPRSVLRRDLLSIALLSTGILTKYLPAAALPWLLRGKGAVQRTATLFLLCALGFAPFLLLRGSDLGVFSGLQQYAQRWEASSLVHRWIEGAFDRFFARDESWTDPRLLARAVSGLAWLAFAVQVVRRETDAVRGTGRLIGAWLVLSPTLHPWYLAWMLPFLAFRSSAAWSWLIVGAPLLYWPIARWQEEGNWLEPVWLWPVVALPFFALLASEWLVRRRRPAVARSTVS